MRRSEAIQQLIDYLCGKGVECGACVDSFVAANEIMELVEKLGMLPPPKELEDVTQHIFYYRFDKKCASYHMEDGDPERLHGFNLWDKE